MMELDAILEQIKEDIARKKLKHEHPYTLDIVRVLWTHKDGLARGRVIDNLERQRKRDGLGNV